MVLPVIKFPHKVLRLETETITFPLSKQMLKLTKDMVDTVRHTDGIGLAAPQVGKSFKLVVINLEKNGIPPFVMYNPKIIQKSLAKVEIEEGCLSLPGIYGMVKRSKKVTIEAQNMEGETVRISDDGWVSRVAQHEIDHINGILIVDLITKYTQGEKQAELWKKDGLI